jgi:hypothetical protein
MSAYQTKIEKALAKLSFGANAITVAHFKCKLDENGQLPTTIYGDDEFGFEKFYYSSGQICDLCGHNPIKRVYVIKSITTKKEAHIGCECAKNYIDADIVDGLSKIFNFEYNKIINPIKYETEVEAIDWAIENKIRLPYRISGAGVEGVRTSYDLINGGSPRSVKAKIDAGKAVTKKEKQVLAVWSWVYSHRVEIDLINSVGRVLGQLGEVVKRAKLEAEIVSKTDEQTLKFGDVYNSVKDAPNKPTVVESFVRKYEAGFQIGGSGNRLYIFGGVGAYEGKEAIIFSNGLGKVSRVDEAIEKVGENDFLKSLRDRVSRGLELSERQAAAVERILAPADEVDALVAKAEKGEFGPKKKEFINSICEFYHNKGYISRKQIYYLEKAVGV